MILWKTGRRERSR